MQSETIDFALVPPAGELDQTTLSYARLVKPPGKLDEMHSL